MKFIAALFVFSLLVESLSSEKLFFPGAKPHLSEGMLQLKGYYFEPNQAPILVPDAAPATSRDDDAELSDDVESRFFSRKLPALPKVQPDTRVVQLFPPISTRLQFTETVTVTEVVPPVCVACKCLQGSQTCAAAGGYILITETNTVPADVPAGLLVAPYFGAPGAIACGATTPAGPLTFPNAAIIPSGTAISINCLIPPPATLSVCDPACRITTGLGSTCLAAPSIANCPRFPAPATCQTDCRNLAIGDRVRCNNAFPTVISPRPTNLCAGIVKREARAEERSDVPELESSMLSATLSKMLPSFGATIDKTTATNTVTRTGFVTATYVPNANCLPRNFLEAPDC